MTFDPLKSPESGVDSGDSPVDSEDSPVDSGDANPSGPGGASRPAPAEAAIPEAEVDGPCAPPAASDASAVEARESEAHAHNVAALAEKALKAEEYLGLAQR